jgi:hypothetical protein
MGRCRDCASYPWAVQADTTTFSATNCDIRLKRQAWTPARRDAENSCPFFKDKNAEQEDEDDEVSIAQETIQDAPKRRRRRRN